MSSNSSANRSVASTASGAQTGAMARIRDLIVGENTGVEEMRAELDRLNALVADQEQELSHLRGALSEQEARLQSAARALLGSGSDPT